MWCKAKIGWVRILYPFLVLLFCFCFFFFKTLQISSGKVESTLWWLGFFTGALDIMLGFCQALQTPVADHYLGSWPCWSLPLGPRQAPTPTLDHPHLACYCSSDLPTLQLAWGWVWGHQLAFWVGVIFGRSRVLRYKIWGLCIIEPVSILVEPYYLKKQSDWCQIYVSLVGYGIPRFSCPLKGWVSEGEISKSALGITNMSY